MEFGSTQRSFLSAGRMRETSRQTRRPRSRNQMMKPLRMVDSSSSDDEDDDNAHRSTQVQNASKRNRMQEIFHRQQENEDENREDDLLKDLGLYEEGMTKEQKREFLMVIEASKESAKKEASMRESGNWENDVVVISDPDSAVPLYDHRFPATPKDKVDDLVTVGDSDDDTKVISSQQVHPSDVQNEPDNVSTQENADDTDPSNSIFGEDIFDGGYSMNLGNLHRSGRLLNRFARKRQAEERKLMAMEEELNIWTPKTAAVVDDFLMRKTEGLLVDDMPYYCPSGWVIPTYTKLILKDLNRYHANLQLVQRRVSAPMPWGDPIVLGRSRILSRYRNLDIPASLETNKSDDDLQPLPDLDEFFEKKKEGPAIESRVQESPKSIQSSLELVTEATATQCEAVSPGKVVSPVDEMPSVEESGASIEFDHQKDINSKEKSAKLSLEMCALETELDIVPGNCLPDKDGGTNKSIEDGDFEVKPKKIRKRNKTAAGGENVSSNTKKSKSQAKNKHVPLIKSLYIPLQRVDLTPDFQKYTGGTSHDSSSANV